jgi:hypothetical protein
MISAKIGRERRALFLAAGLLAAALTTGSSYGQQGDFDLSRSRVDLRDLMPGGPPKDGIPALTSPGFVAAGEARHLADQDVVLGISLSGQDKAYPLRMLTHHEIVNDAVAGIPVAVTWCPLTSSAIVFDRRLDGETLEFGVSGLLYNSNLVMYDRKHACLWPQLTTGAVTGKLSSKRLKLVPSLVITWGEWRIVHPNTLVLSPDTGFPMDYNFNPYLGYQASPKLMFPVKGFDNRLPPKSLVIGIRIKNVAKAYPIQLINGVGYPLEDAVAGISIRIHPGFGNTAYITDDQGNLMPATVAYWFAWSAFNRDTLLHGEVPWPHEGEEQTNDER